jgi:hypothetical protein
LMITLFLGLQDTSILLSLYPYLEEAKGYIESCQLGLQSCLISIHCLWNAFKRFFQFCLGKLEPYYLRKHLEAKPQLNDMAGCFFLPDECFLSSEMSANKMSSKLTSTHTPSASSNTSGW